MHIPASLFHKPPDMGMYVIATVSGPLKIPCCIELAQLESDKAASALFKKEMKIRTKSLRPTYLQQRVNPFKPSFPPSSLI